MYSQTLEILEVADTQDLTVLATAKEELGIASSDTSQDAKLSRWIHEVSGQINARINRVLGREKVQETFECGWQGHVGALPLSRYPVAQVDSVTAATSSLTTVDYRLDSTKGLLYRTYGRWTGEVIVSYQAGMSLLNELPYDVERAALLLIRYRHTAGLRDPTIRSETIPGVFEQTFWVGSVPGSDASMPAEVTELLRPYMDVAV